ncbi:MAG TPA: chemotaxis protein CheC [Bacillota bacterium]|nr:chemotaxis protein CheC [Bacillota bacterium]
MTTLMGKVTPAQQDVLKEVCNIGAGSAATSLAEMLRCKITMTVPGVRVMPLTQIADTVGGPEKKVVGIYQRALGEAPCNILFLIATESALPLLDIILNRSFGTTSTLDDLGMSAIQEVGNIVSGSFMNALHQFTQIKFTPTVPAVAVDMVGAMLNTVLYQYGFEGDLALIIETEFTAQDQRISGNFFLFPDPGPLNKILKSLGV